MINYQCLWLARALVCSRLCITKNHYFTVTYEISRLYQSTVSDLLDAACYSPVLCLSVCLSVCQYWHFTDKVRHMDKTRSIVR